MIDKDKIEKGMTLYRAFTNIETDKVEIAKRTVIGVGAVYVTTEGRPGGRDRLTKCDAMRRYSSTPEEARAKLHETMQEAVKSAERRLAEAKRALFLAFGEGENDG